MSLLLPGFLSWLSKLQFCSIILFLILQEANAQIQIDPGCAGHVPAVNNALREAVAMAEFAYQRTIGLRDGTLPPRDARTTFNTFQAYFTPAGLPDPNAAANGNYLLGKPSSSGRP